jgi:hypothetical protein
MEKPSLLPLHEACPPHLLDPSFRMMPFENFESLRDAMRLMPGRTDVVSSYVSTRIEVAQLGDSVFNRTRKRRRERGALERFQEARNARYGLETAYPTERLLKTTPCTPVQELEKRRAENQRLNMQTAPASLQRPSLTTAGPRSPFYPGQGRSSSRPASPMPVGAGSPAGSVGSPGPGGEAPKIKLKLNFGGSPKP